MQGTSTQLLADMKLWHQALLWCTVAMCCALAFGSSLPNMHLTYLFLKLSSLAHKLNGCIALALWGLVIASWSAFDLISCSR